MEENLNIQHIKAISTSVVIWFSGIAIASGFWSTSISICFPPYALYLFIERLLMLIGFI